MSSRTRTLTHDTFLAELRKHFGPDTMQWAFQCPNCRDTATGAEFRDALAAHPRTDPHTHTAVTARIILGQECIGRTLGALTPEGTDRGCNWAAYGMIPGPWTVVRTDGSSSYTFPIAVPVQEDAR